MLLRILQYDKRYSIAAIAIAASAIALTLYIRSAPSTNSTPAPTATQQQPLPQVTDSKSQMILELFSPSDPYLTRELNETALSQQIEQLMTTSFVLTKCDIISNREYRDNFRALITYAQRMNLAPDMATAETKVRRIAESSATSYSLVYSRTRCDDPTLAVIAKQLLAWQKNYLDD